MNLEYAKKFVSGVIKGSFRNKKVLDKLDNSDEYNKLTYNGEDVFSVYAPAETRLQGLTSNENVIYDTNGGTMYPYEYANKFYAILNGTWIERFNNNPAYIGYDFKEKVILTKVCHRNWFYASQHGNKFVVQASNDGETWIDIQECVQDLSQPDSVLQEFTIENKTRYQMWRIMMYSRGSDAVFNDLQIWYMKPEYVDKVKISDGLAYNGTTKELTADISSVLPNQSIISKITQDDIDSLHTHDNKETLLDKLTTDSDDNVLYDGSKICKDEVYIGNTEPTDSNINIWIDTSQMSEAETGGGKEYYEYYDTEERCIGRWVDGKPLYRKGLDIGGRTFNNGNTIPTGVNNIDKIVKIYGNIYGNGWQGNYNPVYHAMDGSWGFCFYYNGTNIQYSGANNVSDLGSGSYLFIDYTKTTDAVNSFTPSMLS